VCRYVDNGFEAAGVETTGSMHSLSCRNFCYSHSVLLDFGVTFLVLDVIGCDEMLQCLYLFWH
jgi:hypothetical protein